MTTTATEKPARKSRAQRAAEKAADDTAKQPEQPTTGDQQPTADPKPAKPKEPTATEKRIAVFTALCRAAGNLLDSFDLESDDDGAAIECHQLGVTKEEARAVLSHRLSYCGNTDKIWDSRLGPVPTGRGKFV